MAREKFESKLINTGEIAKTTMFLCLRTNNSLWTNYLRVQIQEMEIASKINKFSKLEHMIDS